ncbi:MAG TPA: HAD family hydrolase [Lacipirellulaceae bacterium]|jgi:phosphoglycolate phosphatase-like HAD superfamily hydrolase|nr:HAD family hydrolase [Lacipirellulaceae bacterium]
MLSITPKHDFLVGIDSDGCVFDSMELKHKECFIPAFINHYELQGVSKYAREAAEFVNLYSKSRGANRFPALVEQLDWLRRRPEVKARGILVARPKGLIDWVARETKLGNPALEKAVTATGDPDLTQTLAWSHAVNKAIAEMVRGVPPFPFVRQCLERFAERADMLVCSQTPNAALEAEWAEHDLSRFVLAICGQEVGSKKESLAAAKQYPPNHTLMIGDAPGDYKAAAANHCLFFPINPGAEEASWRRLFEEGIRRFFEGSFAGAYQERLLAEFDASLPERPPWKVDEE